MNILDTVVALNEVDEKSIKIIAGEVGSGKTSFHKDMPEIAGGDILYLPIGNDKGFNQLKQYEGFKTLPQPITTKYVMNKGRKVAIKERIIPQIVTILESYLDGNHSFKGLTIDAISTVQELVEMEIRFGNDKNLEFDDWGSIKKAMFKVYELCEEIASQGHEVSLQTHFQIREHEDTYSGQKTTRLLPMMTEGNAVRVLKNADAFVMIQAQADDKDPKKVHRMSIVGGHPTIPTKIRNEYNLSFDGILFENLTYGGLVKLMQIESLDEATNLDEVIVKKEKDRSELKKKKKEPKVEPVEEEPKVEKPKRKPARKAKQIEEEKTDDEEKVVEEEKPEKPSKVKKPPKQKNRPELEEANEEDIPKKKKIDPEDAEEPPKPTKPEKKKPISKRAEDPTAKKLKHLDEEDLEEDELEDEFADDEELEDEDLFEME